MDVFWHNMVQKRMQREGDERKRSWKRKKWGKRQDGTEKNEGGCAKERKRRVGRQKINHEICGSAYGNFSAK